VPNHSGAPPWNAASFLARVPRSTCPLLERRYWSCSPPCYSSIRHIHRLQAEVRCSVHYSMVRWGPSESPLQPLLLQSHASCSLSHSVAGGCERSVKANPSIERTSSSRLRRLPAAAHVER
jgi:hypothetical protein